MDNNNSDNKEYSRQQGNLEVLNKKKGKEDEGIKLNKEGFKMSKDANIFIGSLNLNSHLKRRHEKFYKHSNFHFWIDVILAALVVFLLIALLVISLWNPKEKILLTSQVNNDFVVSGEIQTFTLKYNTKQRTFNNNISVNLPKNFELLGVVPSKYFNEHTNTFNLPDMVRGANGKIKITGYTIGEVGSQQAISFTFNCESCQKQGYLNSLFYNLENSAIKSSLELPDTIYGEIENKATLTIKNTSARNFEHIIIEISPDWKINNHNLIKDSQTIELKNLKSKETKKISFNIEPKSLKEEVPLVIKTYLQTNSKKLFQKEIKKNIKVRNIDIDTELITTKNQINISEETPFILKYTNTHPNNIKDVKISFESLNKTFNLEELKVSNNKNLKIEDNTVYFKEIPSQKQETLELLATFSPKEKKIEQSINLGANLNYKTNGETVNYSISSPELKVNSQLHLDSFAYYYSPQGDQIGVGPLPPKVDIPTQYWVFWDLENFGNDLENITVTGELPRNVFLADSRSVFKGNIIYGQETKKVAWKLDKLNKNVEEAQAKFSIEVIPTRENINQTMTLLENIKIKAFDTFTQTQITKEIDNITTNLKKDSLVEDKFKVVP